MQKPIPTIETVPLSILVLDPENARLHPESNLDAISGSLGLFGQVEPLVVQAHTQRVIGGNGRLAAMRALGWDKAQVAYVDCSDTEATALGLALNRTAETASWDTETLATLLERCRADAISVESFGFDENAIEKIIARSERDAVADILGKPESVDEDDTKPIIEDDDEGEDIALPDVAKTKMGDIYQLGDSRLMCGDSTSAQDVARLMAGKKADLVFTSPPYSQQRDYGKKISDWDALMGGVFASLQVTDEAQILVNLGMVHDRGEWLPYWDRWLSDMRSRGWRRFGLYVWDQGAGMPGVFGGRFAPCFELIFHFNKVSRNPNKTKDCKGAGTQRSGGGTRNADGTQKEWAGYTHISEKKIPDSVVRAHRHVGNVGGHPAPFSVALVKEIVEAYSDIGGIVYEPFCGSGTTLLGCYDTGRIGFGMEIEPKYCDIIVSRWERRTNQKASLISDAKTKSGS